MRIGVQGHGYGGVSEKLLHYLRVHAPAKEQRGAGVSEVMEAHLGQASRLQERLEGAPDQVPGVAPRTQLLCLDTS